MTREDTLSRLENILSTEVILGAFPGRLPHLCFLSKPLTIHFWGYPETSDFEGCWNVNV